MCNPMTFRIISQSMNYTKIFEKKGVRVTERRCTGRLHPFLRVTRVTGG